MMDPLLHDYEETFVHAVESANSLASQATSYTDDPCTRRAMPGHRRGDPLTTAQLQL